jgi:hypothetical protein
MRPILAYLDPGSSSAIIQMIAGGFAAAAVALKLFWRRILTFLHLRREETQQDESPRRKTAG